ncbi:MAG: N-acetylmuramic acid 6-phosphate etherase [Candidatus Kapaibacterium sp.]
MPGSELFDEISSLETEMNNPRSANIDQESTRGILEIINREDRLVAEAVAAEIPHIERAVDKLAEAFAAGGRLFYFGSGTSGRLGVVDASECPPTFGTPPEMVQGIIAGGTPAIFRAQEGAEDSPEAGAEELRSRDVGPPDVVCGIAASGRTPFVRGALDEARARGIFTIMISTVSRERLAGLGIRADVMICPAVGPEVIAGSTRMKSGTAQKMVLNMLTTGAMVRMGKTLGNVMVDLQLTNAKLRERARRIIMTLGKTDYETAGRLLSDSGGSVKTALVMAIRGVGRKEAEQLLGRTGGFVRKAVDIKTDK